MSVKKYLGQTKGRELGLRLQALRKARKLTQSELANLTDISIRHLQQIESAQTSPKLETLEQLARSLGVEVYQLLAPSSEKVDNISTKNLENVATLICPLDLINVHAAVVDANGIILLVNSKFAATMGYTRDELLGKPTRFLLKDEARAHEGSRFKSFIVENRPVPTPYVTIFKKKNNDCLEATIHWNYLLGETKSIEGFFCTFSFSALKEDTKKNPEQSNLTV